MSKLEMLWLEGNKLTGEGTQNGSIWMPEDVPHPRVGRTNEKPSTPIWLCFDLHACRTHPATARTTKRLGGSQPQIEQFDW